MASDQFLAEMFAAEFKNRLSWRRVPRMPDKSEQPYCWHWKRFAFGPWRPVPTASLPLEWLTNYAKLDSLDATPEQLTPEGLARVLELAKELLRG